jgi:hypothetical protein
MHLKDHILISDFSIHLNSALKHYEWDLNEIAFSPEERSLSSQWLAVLAYENVGHSMLNLICQDIPIECHSSSWKYIFSLLAILAFFFIAVTVGYILMTHHLATLKAQILHTIMRILPKSLLWMIQPPPSPPELPLQPLLLEPIQ